MQRLAGIQYLRAVAASAVIVFHVLARYQVEFAPGRAGVDLFFVISGFLMIVITRDARSPAGFLRARIERVVPLYWIATTALLLLERAGHMQQAPIVWVLQSYLFIPAVAPNGGIYPPLGPGWTLNLEAAFYVLVAVLILLIRSQQGRVLAICILLAGAASVRLFTVPAGAPLLRYTDPIIVEFAFGACVGLAWLQVDRWHWLCGWPAAIVGVALLSTLPFISGVPRVRPLIFGLPCLLILIAALWAEREGRFPRYRVVEWIGDASYSLYLWHTIIIAVFFRLNQILGLPRTADLAITMAAAFVGPALAYVAIEQPLLRWLRERRHGRVAVRRA